MTYNLFFTLGRWSANYRANVEDLSRGTLSRETLRSEALKYLESFGKSGTVPPEEMAYQVLIWRDVGGTHNLIAVYDIRSHNLTEFKDR